MATLFDCSPAGMKRLVSESEFQNLWVPRSPTCRVTIPFRPCHVSISTVLHVRSYLDPETLLAVSLLQTRGPYLRNLSLRVSGTGLSLIKTFTKNTCIADPCEASEEAH